MNDVKLECIDGVDVQFVGTHNHPKLGPVAAYVKAKGNTIHYIIPKCSWCGGEDVLSGSSSACMCYACSVMRNGYSTALSQVSNWTRHKVKPMPPAYYYRLKSFVDTYKERRAAGLQVPKSLEKAERLCECYELQVLSEK